MGKNRREKTAPKSRKTKIIVIAVIIVIGIAGVSAGLMGGSSPDGRHSVDTTRASPMLGSESAPVTIIEFGDYQCPFCQRWNQNTKPLIESNYIDTGKASLIYVDFPIVGPDSVGAHASSYCASEQGLYWEYHDFVYKNQGHENDGWASANSLKLMAAKMAGLDTEAFSECVDSKKYEERVLQNKDVAIKSGVKSTPTFIIIGQNGKAAQITGAQPYGTFQSIIDQKLAEQ